jgi:hypothetical protein
MASTTIQDVKRHLWLHGTVSTETDPNELLRELLAEHERLRKLLRSRAARLAHTTKYKRYFQADP